LSKKTLTKNGSGSRLFRPRSSTRPGWPVRIVMSINL